MRLAAPVVGFAFDRLGPRLLMPFGAALVGLGFLLSSFSTSLLHLHFSYGVVTALGQGALGFVGHNALISFWFVRRRATAIGIASMGQGLGALVMVPATQMLDQLRRLALDLYRHGQSLVVSFGAGQRVLSAPRAGKMSDNSPTATRRRRRAGRAPGGEPPGTARLGARRSGSLLSLLVHHDWPSSARHRAIL